MVAGEERDRAEPARARGRDAVGKANLLERAGPLLRPIRRYTGPLSLMGGVILILLRLLILTGRLDQLTNMLLP